MMLQMTSSRSWQMEHCHSPILSGYNVWQRLVSFFVLLSGLICQVSSVPLGILSNSPLAIDKTDLSAWRYPLRPSSMVVLEHHVWWVALSDVVAGVVDKAHISPPSSLCLAPFQANRGIFSLWPLFSGYLGELCVAFQRWLFWSSEVWLSCLLPSQCRSVCWFCVA